MEQKDISQKIVDIVDCRYSTCNKCGKKGHFSSMCFSKSDSANNNSQISSSNQHKFKNQHRSSNRQQYQQRQNKHNQKHHVNHTEIDENSDEDIYAFQLGKQNSTYPIEINNTTANVIIDSGSTINIIDETAFNNIPPKPPNQPKPEYSRVNQNNNYQ